MREIFKPWVDCLKEKECVSPTGAEKKNHAYDQSALSIFVHKQVERFSLEYCDSRDFFTKKENESVCTCI